MSSENFYNPYPVGTKVHDLMNGRGIVIDVRPEALYPVYVQLENGTIGCYTLEGKEHTDDLIASIYKFEVEVVEKR